MTVLEAAGFTVSTASYESLLAMTERGRIDCFLRAVNEALDEVTQHKPRHPRIAVESDLLLVYPFASFFFVSKDNAELGEALENGLRRAYDDGAFIAHFNSHPMIRAIFAEGRFELRRRFHILNPLMTEETLSIPTRYWHDRTW